MYKTLITLLIILILLSCGSVIKDEPEREIREFIATFSNKLSKTNEVLGLFSTGESAKALHELIRILQNKREKITSTPNFGLSKIIFDQDGEIEVDIPIDLKTSSRKSDESFQLKFWLRKIGKDYFIVRTDGEKLYHKVLSMIREEQWELDRIKIFQERDPVYELAHTLEDNFDSLVWFTKVHDSVYFYAVKGTWTNYFLNYKTKALKNNNCKMGLINSKGETIIPIDFDLIGTIGFDNDSLVEVQKQGKIGYYNIKNKKEVVKPDFDWVVPVFDLTVSFVMKRDTTFGWMDNEYQYHEGFSSEQMKNFVKRFGYLKPKYSIESGQYNFVEIPDKEYAGRGILIPPAYLSQLKFFDEIVDGICVTKIPLQAWTASIESEKGIYEQIKDGLNYISTAVTEHYLEGREEFYERSTISFTNEVLDTMGAFEMDGTRLGVRLVDNNLIEVTADPEYDRYYGDCNVDELPVRTFFSIDSVTNKVACLTSKRMFAETQFVKLDEVYFDEKWRGWDPRKQSDNGRLTIKTLKYMRNEILRDYGYRFKSSDDAECLISETYEPKYSNLSDFEDQLTEIDRHNLKVLDEFIQRAKDESL